MNEIKKAVAYARFSSDHQREESIDAQLRGIREFAQKNNIVIVGEYIDRARSATTDNRPEFLRMIDDSKKHEWNTVMVHKLDRFSRNRFDAEFYKRTLMRNGVILRSVTENLDDSPESVILESVIQGMSEYYSKNLAREVMKGQKENAYQCKHTGGTPPYGFSIEPETMLLVINEEEAVNVRYIFQRIIDGIGYETIVEELNRRGAKTRTGGGFCSNTISTMVRNQKYAGVYVFNRSASKDIDGKRNGHAYKPEEEWIVIEGGCPAIISKEDFEYVSLKRLGNKEKFLGHRKIEEYLLTGKVICGDCGGAYVGERRWDKRRVKAYIKYGCNMKKRKGASTCTSSQIDRDELESFVLRMLAEEIFSDNMADRIVGYYQQFCDSLDRDKADFIESMKKRVINIEKDIETLVDLITKNQSESLLGRLSRLEDEKKTAKLELDRMLRELEEKHASEEEIRSAFWTAKSMLRKGHLANLKQIVELFIKQVTIYNDGILVEFNFARQRTPAPPNINRHLPIREQILLMHGQNNAADQTGQPQISENVQTENQCVTKVTHWSGGEGGI